MKIDEMEITDNVWSDSIGYFALLMLCFGYVLALISFVKNNPYSYFHEVVNYDQ